MITKMRQVLTKRRFRAWLFDKSQDKGIYTRRSIGDCALAVYLQDATRYHHVYVMDNAWHTQGHIGFLPLWASKFIVKVDSSDRTFLLADEARVHLEAVR
jgi:hypothetical protein